MSNHRPLFVVFAFLAGVGALGVLASCDGGQPDVASATVDSQSCDPPGAKAQKWPDYSPDSKSPRARALLDEIIKWAKTGSGDELCITSSPAKKAHDHALEYMQKRGGCDCDIAYTNVQNAHALAKKIHDEFVEDSCWDSRWSLASEEDDESLVGSVVAALDHCGGAQGEGK